LMVVLLIFGLFFRNGGSHTQGNSHKMMEGISNCWETFKKENCDISNPIGSFCRSLY
jgi:hypothetical protein